MINPPRHKRHTPSHVTHRAMPVLPSQTSHTPKGCDCVTLVDLVPIPPILRGQGGAVNLVGYAPLGVVAVPTLLTYVKPLPCA